MTQEDEEAPHSHDEDRGLMDAVASDPRCKALSAGLCQLSLGELRALEAELKTGGRVLLDGGNYDAGTDLWCPLAVGLNVQATAEARWPSGVPSEDAARALIIEIGRERHSEFGLNPIRGIPGDFYRSNRLQDLRRLTAYVISQQVSGNVDACGVPLGATRRTGLAGAAQNTMWSCLPSAIAT